MAFKIKKPAGTATVSKETKDKSVVVSSEQEQEDVAVPASEAVTAVGELITQEPPCTVGMELSYTHNLGNYQSTRVGVSLTIPCAHSEINETYDYAKEWVEERMNALVEELPEAS